MRIAYAYLKQQTWLYRRNYPKSLQPLLGQALKQSLKTGDAKVAKVRAAEINAKFEEIVANAKKGIVWSAPIEWSVKNVSAWSASGLSGQCFPALVDGIPESCAV